MHTYVRMSHSIWLDCMQFYWSPNMGSEKDRHVRCVYVYVRVCARVRVRVCACLKQMSTEADNQDMNPGATCLRPLLTLLIRQNIWAETIYSWPQLFQWLAIHSWCNLICVCDVFIRLRWSNWLNNNSNLISCNLAFVSCLLSSPVFSCVLSLTTPSLPTPSLHTGTMH